MFDKQNWKTHLNLIISINIFQLILLEQTIDKNSKLFVLLRYMFICLLKFVKKKQHVNVLANMQVF